MDCMNKTKSQFLVLKFVCIMISAANKYSSASHHEQKNKKTTSQIKFLAVTIKQ